MKPALTAAALVLTATAAFAAQPHDHGVARLDIGVEPARVLLTLALPLDAAVGFERAPRSDAERERARAALARLRDAAALFRIDGAAGCTPGAVKVQAPALEGGAAEGHADADAEYEFNCRAGARAGFVEVGLFDAFPALRRVELQVVTPRGQLKATLAKPASRVALVR